MTNFKMKDIKKITLQEVQEFYNKGLILVVKDGKIKGIAIEKKETLKVA